MIKTTRTKIVCTIGPASEKLSVIKRLITAGMDVARLNFSHGDYKSHKNLIKNIREAGKELGKDVTIVQDLQGPRIRLGVLPEKGIEVKAGKQIILTTHKKYENTLGEEKIYVTYPNLHKDIKKNDTVLIKDGLIKGRVVKKRQRDIYLQIEVGGTLETHKGLNFPDTRLTISPLTNKDLEDLSFGLKNDVDFVAMSFVSHGKDIKKLRKIIDSYGEKYFDTGILAKVEKPEAIENIDSIISEVDGIMVARGDLGIELPPEEVPVLQKMIIDKCRRASKPVIVATQMMESMMSFIRPTRAEVSDVANAVIDHTDAVMLSGESAGGKYPVQTVQMMTKTLKRIEKSDYDDVLVQEMIKEEVQNLEHGIGILAALLSEKNLIDGIILKDEEQEFSYIISKLRPELPIMVCTDSKKFGRQLQLSWGIIPVVLTKSTFKKNTLNGAIKFIHKEKVLKKNSVVLYIDGLHYEKPLNINITEVII